ncbi:hypothetical protein EPR50_G00195200 [Perca flavescens]|uniref:G2/mitotic-specific cyclin-B2 n=1 Tax=Perca flavescens TaxID=8167 RepID=A0A484C6X9_PERFV|nr:hypothetical protein EPR50_G00195200 [Perca flavescens]
MVPQRRGLLLSTSLMLSVSVCLSVGPTAMAASGQAHKVQISLPGRKKEAGKKQVKKTSAPSVSAKNHANLTKSLSVSSDGSPNEKEKTDSEEGNEEVQKAVAAPVEELVAAAPPAAREVPAHLQKQPIPEEFDIDSENSEDCYMCPEYAKEIFDYLKQREEKFVLCNYMPQQPSLNPEMRAILIDWLVEVQENFELYHETLYLAVKMADHYLSKTPVHRELLQLVGSTAMLIASKFEGAQSTLCRRLSLYLRRCVQEGGDHLHGGQHPAGAVLRHQHPHPLSVPQTLCQVCERRHGHADPGPVLLRDESHGDGAGVRERLAARLSLPADGARHQRPGRMASHPAVPLGLSDVRLGTCCPKTLRDAFSSSRR